jgi:hypothetical protein
MIVWDKKDTARNGLWKSEIAWTVAPTKEVIFIDISR